MSAFLHFMHANRLAVMVAMVLVGNVGMHASDLGMKQGRQWFPFIEWRLVNPTWQGNAFDVLATVEFTHKESGAIRRTEMFYAGGHEWAFRFSGIRTGSWSFVTASADANLAGHRGSVVVAPREGANGFLKSFGSKWGWQGTERAFVPQLIMWDYIAGGNSPMRFHQRPEFIRRLIDEFIVEHGFKGFHFPVVGGRWFDLEAVTDRVDASMTEPDPETFEALEGLIIATHRAGGMVHLWSWGDHQRSQTPRSLPGGIGGAVDRRLERYIAARLGPVPGWSMGYGFDLDEWVDAGDLKSWRDRMQRHMGWPHFLGGRPEGPNHGTNHQAYVAWNRGLDYSSYEHHRPTYEVYLAAQQTLPGQPVLSEDRFRVRESRYPEKDYHPELVRRGLYRSTMAGGVGNIWGISPELSRGGIFPNKDEISTYSLFFHRQSRFLADMSPANGLASHPRTRILQGKNGRRLILYGESTDTFEVDLTGMPHALPVVAVDATKAYREIVLDPLLPGRQTVHLPRVSDWAVAIGMF